MPATNVLFIPMTSAVVVYSNAYDYSHVKRIRACKLRMFVYIPHGFRTFFVPVIKYDTHTRTYVLKNAALHATALAAERTNERTTRPRVSHNNRRDNGPIKLLMRY